MSHMYEAKALMREFPEETSGFSVFEVNSIWEAYSESMAAGWITPNKENVEMQFNAFKQL